VGPFRTDDPLPGAYELHLPSDNVTVWYVVTPHEDQEIITDGQRLMASLISDRWSWAMHQAKCPSLPSGVKALLVAVA
jgi:hypothetical protein